MLKFFLTSLHVLSAILLVTIILMQSGRSSGLTEAFSGSDSIFGTQTNKFLVKVTTVFATTFLITSLSLAYLHSQKDKSLMSHVKPKKTTTEVVTNKEVQADKDAVVAEKTADKVEDKTNTDAPAVEVVGNKVAE